MSAYILVFNHPFFAVTDDDGRYAIPGVPSGTYTLAGLERARTAGDAKGHGRRTATASRPNFNVGRGGS